MKLHDFGLERFFARHEFAVKHLMCASDCESMTTEALLAFEPGSAELLLEQTLGYTETLGNPALRAAIAGLYTRVKPDQTLVFSGAQEPIFAFMNVVLEPGDGVVVHVPCYQSLHEVGRAVGAEVKPWVAREANGWQLDPDELPKLCTEKTKVLVINSPHNPTGAVVTGDRFDAIVKFCRARGLWLFSDEVYRGLEHDQVVKNAAACDVYEKAVSLGTTAKTYGLAGLRVGWIATQDLALIGRLAAFKDYLTICNSAPGELLATVALKHHEKLAARSRELVRANLTLFEAFARPHGINFVRPTGGSVLFAHRKGGERWCEELLHLRGVCFAPGRLFGGDPDHFRVGLGRTTFAAGLDAIR
ncbi:MAG: aminotransferase class I/II-fold pyridoxal phosphate-dependent enzyme [Myxococcaceae bacterium]|nr:aminotransferase class I/II-fold pyridoxal phosphate-dependent enzyme [Myxococcaceae bacterium]